MAKLIYSAITSLDGYTARAPDVRGHGRLGDRGRRGPVDWTLEVVVQMHVEPLIREEDRGRFGAS